MTTEATGPLSPYLDVARLFGALANPTRCAIVERLTVEPRFVGELSQELGLSQPLVSQHLKVLREAHLVEGFRDGRVTRYRLIDEHVAHVFLDAHQHTKEHHNERCNH